MLLVAQIALIAVVAGVVLYPLVRYRGQRAYRESAFEAKQRSIVERKERLYGRMREDAMREVLAVLAEEDALLGRAPGPSDGRAAAAAPDADQVERLIEEYKRKRSRSMEASQA
jgi:hypothetical protein